MASSIPSSYFRVVFVLSAAFAVISMGGCPLPPLGGDGTDVSLPPEPVPEPVSLSVSASASKGSMVGDTVTLTAEVSGADGTFSFSWSQIDGPSAALLSTDQQETSFDPTIHGLYRFTVTAVRDDEASSSASAEVAASVGDIQFVVPLQDVSEFGGGGNNVLVVKGGNPAVLQVDNTISPDNRANIVRFEAGARVFDPLFADDQRTEIIIHYELVSVPSAGRTEDVTLDRDFTTISTQGTGDSDFNQSTLTALDGIVGISVGANPDASFDSLSNVGTLIENFGGIVPGDYVFRATATNVDGGQRSRDLTVTVLTEGINGRFGGRSAGPRTIAVKDLPAGSPGQVTDKVMTSTDSVDMTVSVLPSSDTTYRFYLREDNPIEGLGSPAGDIAHPEFVTASDIGPIPASGSPLDIDLTIASPDDIPTGTYGLYVESFDSLGNVFDSPVAVNNSARQVRFHVTDDFLSSAIINAADVGAVSGDIDTPINFEGWSGAPNGYGDFSALADVNLDGAADIVTATATGFDVNTQGFIDGSTEKLRHPENSANFDNGLAAPNVSVGLGLLGVRSLAAGDVNGDGLPDVAVGHVIGGVGKVRVVFHTGNPTAPYSDPSDQALEIEPPLYDLFQQDNTGDIIDLGSTVSRASFGMRIAIHDVTGDGDNDLIVTDPGFSTRVVYSQLGGSPAIVDAFYDADEGRVYVFAGGPSGPLGPGRPDILASEIVQTQVVDAVATPVSTSIAESNAEYAAVFTGALFDEIGHSLAAHDGEFAVGSPLASVNGNPFYTIAFDVESGLRIPDGATVTTTFGGQTQDYEFDTNAALVNPAAIQVPIDPAATPPGDQPAEALTALLNAINADGSGVVDAAVDPVNDERLILTSIFSTEDEVARGGSSVAPSVFGAFAGSVFTTGVDFNNDGVIYRVADGSTTALLADAVSGTLNSDMGFGAEIAMGEIDGDGVHDHAVSALDSGDPTATNDGFADDSVSRDDDGGVFLLLAGTATLPSPITAGDSTGDAPAASGISPTSVGRHVGIGDIDGDSLAETFFTEPGFDRLHVILGAATPSTTPDLFFEGVVFDNSVSGDDPGAFGPGGDFLFGDITGDTESDWLLLDSALNLGLAGFAR